MAATHRPVNPLTEEQIIDKLETSKETQQRVKVIASDKWYEYHINQQLDIINHAKEEMTKLTTRHQTALKELPELDARVTYWTEQLSKLRSQPRIERMTDKMLEVVEKIKVLQAALAKEQSK